MMSVSNYIRYHEAEDLVKIYPDLEVIINSLQADLCSLQNSIDDEIYTKTIGNRICDSVPPTGSISDKTGNLAIRYKQNLYNDSMQLKQDINTLSTVINKLNYAITGMKTVQRLVLETYYWTEQNTWKEVVEVLKDKQIYMSESKAKRTRNSAIGYIATVSKVTIEQYQFVMGLVG